MNAPITALYAIGLALLVIALAFNVVRLRRSRRIGLGTAGDEALALAVRAHGNAVEAIPFTLLLMLLLELNGAPGAALHGFGAVLLVARLAHAQGLLGRGGGHSAGRFYGTLATWCLQGLAIAGLLVLLVV